MHGIELNWIASLLTLTGLEIVLGIDNVIFISLLVNRIDKKHQQWVRITGLALAFLARVLLLFSIGLLMKLETSWFSVMGHDFSGKDITLLAGGLFLLVKSTMEIHQETEGQTEAPQQALPEKVMANLGWAVFQIVLIDLVFSLDSVITAVGLVNDFTVMVVAILIAIGVMMAGVQTVGEIIETHPSVKMLALSFLLLIGVLLITEAFDVHVPRGYIYFSLAFSTMVEWLNIQASKRRKVLEAN